MTLCQLNYDALPAKLVAVEFTSTHDMQFQDCNVTGFGSDSLWTFN